MNDGLSFSVVLTMMGGVLFVFLPLGLVGLVLWGLVKLGPRLRKSMGYSGTTERYQTSRRPRA